jgi:hypothetical protein
MDPMTPTPRTARKLRAPDKPRHARILADARRDGATVVGSLFLRHVEELEAAGLVDYAVELVPAGHALITVTPKVA